MSETGNCKLAVFFGRVRSQPMDVINYRATSISRSERGTGVSARGGLDLFNRQLGITPGALLPAGGLALAPPRAMLVAGKDQRRWR